MADYEKGFWYDTPYPLPTTSEVELWKKAFNKHYPLSPVEADETFCPSVHSNSKGTHYCSRKSGHGGVHRAKDFAAVAEVTINSYVATLATWGDVKETGRRGQVIATQEEFGNYSDPCTVTTTLVGSNQVTYVFRCVYENGHVGEHKSEIYYKDAVPGYSFEKANNCLKWTEAGVMAPKKVASKKTPVSKLIAGGQVYLAPVGSDPIDAEFTPIGYVADIPTSFGQTLSLTNPNKTTKHPMCMHTVDNKNFCTEKKSHFGHHQGNGFGWYPDSPSVTPVTQRSKLISQAAKIKKDPSLPPEVAQVMQDIIDYLKK